MHTLKILGIKVRFPSSFQLACDSSLLFSLGATKRETEPTTRPAYFCPVKCEYSLSPSDLISVRSDSPARPNCATARWFSASSLATGSPDTNTVGRGCLTQMNSDMCDAL